MNKLVLEELRKRDPSLVEQYEAKYGDAAYKAAQAEAAEQKEGLRLGQAAAGIGAALAGRDPSGSVRNFDQKRKDIDDSTVGAFEKQKSGAARDVEVKKSLGQSDPNSNESISFRKMMERNFPDVAKTYGDHWQNVTAADQDTIFKPLQLRENIEARKQSAALLAGQRADDKKAKLEQKELELAVPGYERTGQVLPKAEEAQKFRKAVAVADQLKSKLSRMKELVKEYGSYEYGGDGGTEMESLATEIQLLGKSPELYELGVLAGPDLTMLQKITADPTSMNSLFTKDASRQKQLDSQLSSIGAKLGSTATSLGYRRAGEAPQEPDVASYAAKHGISYDEAKAIKMKRTQSQAGL